MKINKKGYTSIREKSELQKLWYRVSFAVYFRLQYFDPGYLDILKTSKNTWYLVKEHEKITRHLRQAILDDYREHKGRIKALREK